MISKDDIKKLADLARLEIKEEELAGLAGDMDSILGFVSQVAEITGLSTDEIPEHRNVMREDNDPNTSLAYTEKILAEAPSTQNGYLKVKKIL